MYITFLSYLQTQAKADNEAEKTKAVNNNETNSDKKK